MVFHHADRYGFRYTFRALAETTRSYNCWECLVSIRRGDFDLVMVLVFLLGFFFDWLEICLIVLPISANPRTGRFSDYLGTQAAFLPWFILVAVNLQTSFHAAFGFALFYLKGVMPDTLQLIDIYKGIVPFVLLQLTALALSILFPDLVLWLPRYLGLF